MPVGDSRNASSSQAPFFCRTIDTGQGAEGIVSCPPNSAMLPDQHCCVRLMVDRELRGLHCFCRVRYRRKAGMGQCVSSIDSVGTGAESRNFRSHRAGRRSIPNRREDSRRFRDPFSDCPSERCNGFGKGLRLPPIGNRGLGCLNPGSGGIAAEGTFVVYGTLCPRGHWQRDGDPGAPGLAGKDQRTAEGGCGDRSGPACGHRSPTGTLGFAW